MMGVSSMAYWTSWFLTFALLFVLSSAIVTGALCIDFDGGGGGVSRMLTRSSSSLVFCSLCLYAFALISFIFALSTIFMSRKLLLVVIVHSDQWIRASGVLGSCSGRRTTNYSHRVGLFFPGVVLIARTISLFLCSQWRRCHHQCDTRPDLHPLSADAPALRELRSRLQTRLLSHTKHGGRLSLFPHWTL